MTQLHGQEFRFLLEGSASKVYSYVVRTSAGSAEISVHIPKFGKKKPGGLLKLQGIKKLRM